ncbi:protein containing C-terminal region/beta chain of methionyl-tRNA synthetase [Belliella baltica DSM 15883]|uniref:Methionine--tRNA ligase n=1 Tax=Belliella baltica (strain DSM 15883 / CIP 108006 / LMG 21964 / BA134) TaxID=866536 RepID=I3Z8S4_BELBD|nr:methionine--tRNA ligase [Belliella baltica]AFL85642.1 protein containing C-terminal region/beta chain of methionyl-tRNA synthetase [Belliella baltica DSM 15883]
MNNKEFKRYTVTSALPYANGPLHIGHLAGCYIPSDIYVRYLRSLGKDVAYVCGSDEHGVAITIKAKKEGITPQEVVDRYHEMMKESFKSFGINFDHYSRTSAPIHHETASGFFKDLYDKGEFLEQSTEQYFDEEAGQFLADRYIEGTCPKCGHDGAYGDQCEKCGSSLSPTELINPKSKLSGNTPVLKETKHWFLDLARYTKFLQKWILEDHKEDWKNNVLGQCRSWLEAGDGLQARSMTRDLDWGIPVPVEGADGKVLYVWFDAPIGYISTTKEWANEKGIDWQPYWKDKDTKLVHFIGKDNIVFHCIIFPAILKTHGEYILPDNVPANEFLNLEGDKISTSRNWAVWLHEYLEEFPGKQDVLRYVLTANAPETKDNDFTWKDFQGRNNSELVAVYGNFVNRAVVLTHKFFDGVVPAKSTLSPYDQEVLDALKAFPDKIAASIERYRFREALSYVMDFARLGNKYLADTEPWKTIKENKERTGTILNIALNIGSNLAIVAEPFLPFTSEKIFDMFNLKGLTWRNSGEFDLLIAGDQINPASLLFEKIEDDVVEAQVNKLLEAKKKNEMDNAAVVPMKDIISYDDFAKLDMRVVKVLTAEPMPKSKKLLKLTVDTGLGIRTVLSGVAEYFKPEDLLGKQVTMLINLAPRKMMGIDSEGMILMAEDKDGSLRLLEPGASTANGSTIS